MKHIKKFESFEVNEEILGFGKSADEKAYIRTSEFLESDSEEAKKVKELYAKLERGDDRKILSSPANGDLVKAITRLGLVWANKNDMEGDDYTFKQISTVLEKTFNRPFKGGLNLNVGESVNNNRNRR